MTAAFSMESCGSWFEDLLGTSMQDGAEERPALADDTSPSRFGVISQGLKRTLDMWSSGKNNQAVEDAIFNDLITQCRHNAPGARLSYRLRTKLENLSRRERREIVCRVKDGCAPLFIASLRGHEEIVEYLIKVCDADLEQRGIYEVPDDKSVHCVTPLWCAAVTGRFNVVVCLVELGADVNAASDSGSTPVRSACYMTHTYIVKYLVEHGADISKPNHNGGTCLINSVQSASLCLFLLQHGASVNVRDIQNRTALHYAVQEHRLETTALLLDHGADPHIRSCLNDDALRTACIKGAKSVFHYLQEHVSYEPERLADAYELMGSTLLDEHNDVQGALQYWRIATQLRWAHGENGLPIPKRPVMPPREAFQNAVEFISEEDLHNISLDMDALRMQSLLICERVLGEQHKDTLYRLMFRGANYADAHRHQRCIDLWRRVLEVRMAKDSVLSLDACCAAQALVRLFVDLNERLLVVRHHREGEEVTPRFEDLAAVFKLLSDQLLENRSLLEILPVNKDQQESHDRILRCLTHLIYLLVKTCSSHENLMVVESLVSKLVQHNPCTASLGDSLLHLCVSRMNTIRSSYITDNTHVIFPDLQVVSLLLRCGARVGAQNKVKSTPLHVAANPYNFDNALVQLLLDHGAHIDRPNRNGERPSTLLSKNTHSHINLVNYASLRCLASVAVCMYKVPYRGQVPKTLESFVALHEA